MRVLVVTSMYPTPARPELGVFVRDQVEALRAVDGVEIDVFVIEPDGPGRWLRAAREVRQAYGGERFDVVHAHHGLSGWSALAVGGAPHVVTFHGTDVAHPVVGRMSRALARLIALAAPVSGRLARELLRADARPGPSAGHRRAVLPCGVNLDRFKRRDRREARARLGLEPHGRYLLFPAAPTRPEKRDEPARAVAEAARAEPLTYGGLTPEQVTDPANAADAAGATPGRGGLGL